MTYPRHSYGRTRAPLTAALAVATLLGTGAAASVAVAEGTSGGPDPAGASAAVPASSTPTVTARATPGSGSAASRAPVSGEQDRAMALEVIDLTNAERATKGCGPVHWDVALTAAARLHSEDMADHDYFDHTSRDGRSPWDRIEAQDYWWGSAENIAAGYGSASAVVTAWMNSPGHRANILNCSNTAIGVGIGRNPASTYRIYWTQDFGTR